jgi:CRP/FNR family cyclic AMP-dependent transcriptional regulator
MGSGCGIEITENCLHCELRRADYFCNLEEPALRLLQNTTYPAAYQRGAVLFVEGQLPRGVYLLCRGRVKLTINSRDGKTLILKIAERGEMLGTSAVLLNRPYQLTAEILDTAQLNFIRRGDFLNLLRQSSQGGISAARQLGQEHQLACREIGSLGLAQSAAEKLATLLLGWAGPRARHGKEARIRLTLTHEEMAQMIGTTRETVTRLLGKFRQRELIEFNGCTLVLRNTITLQAVSSGDYELDEVRKAEQAS